MKSKTDNLDDASFGSAKQEISDVLADASIEDLIQFSHELSTVKGVPLNWLEKAFLSIVARYKKILSELNPADGYSNQQKIDAAEFLEQKQKQNELTSKVLEDSKNGPILQHGRLGKIVTGPLKRLTQIKNCYSADAPAYFHLDLLQNLEGNSNFKKYNEYGERGLIKRPGEPDRYYVINQNHKLGVGGFGAVYLAKEIDPQTGHIKPNTPKTPYLAVKKFHKPELVDSPKIIEAQGRYFRNTQAVHDNKSHQDSVVIADPLGSVQISTPAAVDQKTFLFTELLPGQDLKKFFASSEFEELSLEQNIELMEQIFMALNVMHHETPSTGDALVHKDIKPENMMVSVDPVSGAINLYIIDLGSIHLHAEYEDTQKAIVEMDFSGTWTYMAPEFFSPNAKAKVQSGPKSDIFSLRPIVERIFGSDKPLRDKERFLFANKTNPLGVVDVPLNQQGFLAKPKFDVLPPDVKANIRQFSERMGAHTYVERPTTDECLRFSVELKKFVRLQKLANEAENVGEKNSYQSDLKICQGKLSLLAGGHWHRKLGQRNIEALDPKTYEVIETKEMVDQTVGYFVETHPDLVPMVMDTLSSYGDQGFAALELLSNLVEKYPKVEEVIVDLHRTSWREQGKIGNILDGIKTLLDKNPAMERVVADLGYQQLDRIEKLAAFPETEKLMSQFSKVGLLNSQALTVLEYAKDSADLRQQLISKVAAVEQLTAQIDQKRRQMATLVEEKDEPQREKLLQEITQLKDDLSAQRKKLQTQVKIVGQMIEIKEELDNARKTFTPEQLVSLSEYIFSQKDYLPKSILKSMFEKIVDKYIQYKNALAPNKHEGWCFGHTNQEKREAAKELLDFIKNNKQMEPQKQAALHEGKLGEIIDEVEKIMVDFKP